MTGPQRTPDERGDLAELAGLHGALIVSEHLIEWADAQALYTLPLSRHCPLALADVTMALALSIPIFEVS